MLYPSPKRNATSFAAMTALVSWTAVAAGQTSGWTLTSLSQTFAAAGQPSQSPVAPSRGPLARLVRNSYLADGSPPYALADQSGAVQRLVEPVPGIDLEPHVGQVVVVRHDTGSTILASQLELPPRPLMPLVGETHVATGPFQSFAPLSSGGISQAVQLVDDDDSTTQLITDGPSATADGEFSSSGQSAAPPATNSETMVGELAPFELSLDGPQMGSPMMIDGIPADGMMVESWPGGYVGEAAPCPVCGQIHERAFRHRRVLEDISPRLAALGDCRFYADVELQFLRVHFMENAVGKLAEKYEFSPQITIGFDNTGLVDGRARYWIYDRSTPLLSGGSVRFEFHVFDLEATHRFQAGRADVGLAIGMRIAGIDLEDDDGDRVGTDLIGMTLAADARTPLCKFADGTVAWVYGGRLSILGGDWGGSPTNDFIAAPVHDDNVVVEEIYIGVEYAACCNKFNVRSRLAFEIQNWHSDVLAQEAGTDSIGFLGPGIHFGVAY